MLGRFAKRISWVCLIVLPGCGSDRAIVVEDAWVRQINPSQSVTVAYMEITNTGALEDRLLDMTSPAFEAVELHETVMDDAVMRMRRSGPIVEAAGASVALEPGGYHAMLIRPKYTVPSGTDILLTLRFDVVGEITVSARVTAKDRGR